MEKRYFVLKMDDIDRHLTDWYKRILRQIADRIGFMRATVDGKPPHNEYLVINKDEPWFDQILAVMRRNGVIIK